MMMMMAAIYATLLLKLACGAPADTCSAQVDCLAVTQTFDSNVKPNGKVDVEVCVSWDASSSQCHKDGGDTISHACIGSLETEKMEDWQSGAGQALCRVVECDEAAEFGIKDGRGCDGTKKNKGGVLFGQTISGFDGIDCTYDDVEYTSYCHSPGSTACKWTIPTVCPNKFMVAMQIDDGKGGAVPTCYPQSNCLRVTQTPNGAGSHVQVCLVYDNTLPFCIKDGDISHACNGPALEDKQEGYAPGTALCKTVECGTEYDNVAQFGVKDSVGCKADAQQPHDFALDGIGDNQMATCQYTGGYCHNGEKTHPCTWTIPVTACPSTSSSRRL